MWRLKELRNVFVAMVWRFFKAGSYLGFRKFGPLRLLKVRQVGDLLFPRVATLFAGEPAIRSANLQGTLLPKDDHYPALGYRSIPDSAVTSNRRVAAVIQGNSLLIPESADLGPWDVRIGEPTVGGILRQDASYALVNNRRRGPSVPRGIYVGSWSPHNWFHWTIDTLPSVYLAGLLPAKYHDYPILLPDTAMVRGSWLEPLELVIGSREIKFLTSDHYTRVQDLVWIESPTCPGPLPLTGTGFPKFKAHGSAMNAYRAHLLSQLGLDDSEYAPFRKVFLCRSQDGQRPYNQTELLEVAGGFGFEPVFLEELTFKESVQLMLETAHLIGPHGAGWANALFCQEGTRGLMWTWPESINDNWFANIGALRNMSFTTVFTNGGVGDDVFDLTPSVLRSYLQKNHDV
jgi:hypothetical protein